MTVTEDDYPSSDATDFQIGESRRVIDQQIETVHRIDQKAIRTVRIGVIFLGIVLSAIQISGGEIIVNPLTVIGGFAVVASIVVGLYTSSTTDLYFGSGPPLVRVFLANQPREDEWKLTTLRGYQCWLEYNRKVNMDDAKWLRCAQALLATGVLSTVIGFTFAV